MIPPKRPKKPTYSMNGLRIHTDPCLLKFRTDKVKRGWGERLFNSPWRPWEADKDVVTSYPDPDMYIFEGDKLAGHPETVKEFMNKIAEDGE